MERPAMLMQNRTEANFLRLAKMCMYIAETDAVALDANFRNWKICRQVHICIVRQKTECRTKYVLLLFTHLIPGDHETNANN